ncbi:uncharacterized protein LOC116350779 [Contarinia nasturtii]|uniref:uncharacterized protein LOC116350779 n=1 Tax=Contarinia nasturtii TaxID=265458 RepID=UPI0012D373A5|nr:uncharacterized protein LOC116350779 [Contarinia nasturtii]
MLHFLSNQQINGKKVGNARIKMTQSPDNTPLENYVIEKSARGRLTKQVVDEFVQAQRNRIDEMNAAFWTLENTQNMKHSIFINAKIENVVSPREFYIVQVHDLKHRNEFQNVLNECYEDDFEPIDKLRAKDLCVTLYNDNWCRAEVIEILPGSMCKRRFVIYLLDYGHTIRTKMRKLFMLKQPHHSIAPFAVKCHLSVLNVEEIEIYDDLKHSLTEKFKRISETTPRVALYLNRPNKDNQDSYDVMLLSEASCTSGAYLIHEDYGAFSSANIQLDHEICEKWVENIQQIVTDCSHSSDTKNCQVFITHIVGPTEIYVQCKKAHVFAKEIRKKIDAYINSHEYYEKVTDWSIENNCFVRLQNWKVKSNLKQWYRGKIVKENFEKRTFTVFLRDYGVSTEADDIDMRPMPLQFAAPENAVQRCSLHISDVWLESNAKTLRKIVEEYQYFAISCSSNTESCLNVALWATNSVPNIKELEIWDNIGLRLISQSIQESMKPFITKTQFRYDRYKYRSDDSTDSTDSDESYSEEYELLRNLIDDPIKSSPAASTDSAENDECASDDIAYDQESIVYRWQPPIPVDRQTFHGFVTHVTGKGIIYIQEDSFIDIALELSQGISRYIQIIQKSYTKKRNHIFKENDTCFASLDFNTFQRAVIKKINRENGTCLIKFVDYGYKVIMDLDGLYPATRFGDIPILVNRVYVPKLVPGDENGKWHQIVLNEFRSRLINEMCEVRIEGNYQINNILPCSIEPDTLPCDIYKWILKKKLGYIPNTPGAGLNDDGEFLYV